MCSTSSAFASAYLLANDELSVMIGEFTDDGSGEKGTATISGKFATKEAGKYVSVMIFAPNMGKSDIAASGSNQSAIIPFAGSTTSDANGEFTMEVTLTGNSGEYSAYFGPSTDGDPVLRVPVYYSKKSENINVLTTLNSKAAAVTDDTDTVGITDVENYVDNNDNELAFRFSVCKEGAYEEVIDTVDATEVIKTLINYIKATPFDVNDRGKATDVFRTLVFARALTEDKISSLDVYAPHLPIFTGEHGLLKAWYDKAGAAEKTEFISRLKNKSYATLDAFVEKAVEMAVLSRIHHADGDGEVREMLEDFEGYTGIATSELKQAVYDGLERQNFADYTALNTKIEELKKIPDTQYYPPLGGGGGGGGAIGGLPEVSVQEDKYTPIVDKEPINTPSGFSDVSEKDWYYDSVYELYDRGIIAGKSEATFAPNDSITREEVVKMLAVMEKLTLSDNGTVFADVKAGDWFYPYVNAAAKEGIVNGIGDGIFGTGQNVTRQDIAVMLYNIAKAKGVTTEATELTFTDADDIADYAKDAVLMLHQLKVINGYEDLSFRPRNFVTRAEAAKLICEFINTNN